MVCDCSEIDCRLIYDLDHARVFVRLFVAVTNRTAQRGSSLGASKTRSCFENWFQRATVSLHGRSTTAHGSVNTISSTRRRRHSFVEYRRRNEICRPFSRSYHTRMAKTVYKLRGKYKRVTGTTCTLLALAPVGPLKSVGIHVYIRVSASRVSTFLSIINFAVSMAGHFCVSS